jgi:type IV pilus assembly protein PilO
VVGKAFGDYSRPVQAGVLVGLAVVTGGAAFWFWVMPLTQDWSTLNTQLRQLRAQNQANRALEGQRTLLQKRVEEAQGRLEAIKSMVPDEPDPDTIVNLLREAESAAGVHVRSLASQPAVKADEYVELPYKVRVDGTYFAVLSFFDRLANTTRIMNVSGLSLVVPVPGNRGTYKIDPSETVATDFVLSAYYNRAAAAKPPAKKP